MLIKQTKRVGLQKFIYQSIMDNLTQSQKIKQELLPYLKEHYPHLLQRKSRFDRISECSNAVSFRRYIDSGEVKLLNSNFCKYDRICIACAVKRSMRMIKKYTDNIRKYKLDNKHWHMITLTIRHNKYQSLESLLDRIFKLRDRIAQSMKNGKRQEQKTKSFFSVFDGMAIATEITCDMNKNGRHPHFHILACSDTDLPIDYGKYYGCKSTNDDLYYERKKITKDSDQIDIHKINISNKQYSRASIGEVFKYACKFSTLPVDKLAEIMNLQHKNHYRFFSSYGIFRWRKIQDSKTWKWDRSDGVFMRDANEEKYKLDEILDTSTIESGIISDVAM